MAVDLLDEVVLADAAAAPLHPPPVGDDFIFLGLTPKADVSIDRLLEERPEALRELDVILLHDAALGRYREMLLGLRQRGIEPMVTLGSPEVGVLPDAWTIVTIDGSAAAHWEHTVAITESGPWVLTALDDVRL